MIPLSGPVHLPAPAVYSTLPVAAGGWSFCTMGAMLGSLCMGAYGLVLAVNMLWAAGLMKVLSREAKEIGNMREQERTVNVHSLNFMIYTAKDWGTS